MSKFMRVVSTFMVVIGLIFLFVYVRSLGTDDVDILNQPSYYIVRNYWFMFVAGIVTIVFSILGSFFSWFKTMDPVKEALPNAGYATSNDINTWVAGTTADTGTDAEIFTEATDSSVNKETEIVYDSGAPSKETEILLDEQDLGDSETEVLWREGKL